MKPQPHIESDINEFFIDQMSRSELMLEELNEREHFEKEAKEEEEELHELDEWLHSLYGRGVRPPTWP